MLELKHKPTFSSILEKIKQSDTLVGLYVLKEPPKNPTLIERYFIATRIKYLIVTHFINITTLYTTNFSLISIIFCTCAITIAYVHFIFMTNCVWNKETIKKLIKWCEELYDVKKKFHPIIHRLAETHLTSIEKKTTKVMKWCKRTLYASFFFINIVFLTFVIFAPNKIFPKYRPPAPFYLPFKNQDTWTAFSVTTFVHMMIYIDATFTWIFVFNLLATFFYHILGTLDLINEFTKQTVRKMKSISEFEIPTTSRSKLDQAILQSINKSSSSTNEISFEDSMKIITEMIADVNSIINVFKNHFSILFLAIEISNFATVFLLGLIFTILHDQAGFAIPLSFMIPEFWMLCYINEKIGDKFDEINEALYDIPWYELSPKQMKTLMLVLNCDKIQKGFTAAGIHNLTMERFGIIIKSGYANMLILKDLPFYME